MHDFAETRFSFDIHLNRVALWVYPKESPRDNLGETLYELKFAL